MPNKDYKPITINISLSSDTHELLDRSAKQSNRSKRQEATLRVIHSLKNINLLKGDYWEITN